MAIIFFWRGDMDEIIRRVPFIFLSALVFTWPVLIIMGPIFYLYVVSGDVGKRRPPDFAIYAVALVCAFIEFFYLERFSDF
jgi:hypothetical protein